MSVREGYKQTEVGVIPEEWGVTRIGDYCDILDNKRVPLSSEVRANRQGNIPYYGANGVLDYIDKYIFDEELVLLAEDGGNFGDYKTRPIAYMIVGKSWVNNHAHILRAKNGQNHFLYYLLVHKNITAYINGGTRAKLNRGELIKIPIAKPPLPEQQKIAAILTGVDKKIEVIDTQIAKTETLKKGLMQKLLSEGIGHSEFKDSEIGRIPKEWEVVRFKDITKVRQGLQIPISKRKQKPCEKCYQYITIQYVKNNKEVEYIENPQKSVICTENDILMTRTGNTGIVITGVNGVFHNNFFLIDFDRDKISKDFLVFYLKSYAIQKEILLKAGATTIPDLNHGDFYSIKFLLPPLPEQKKIAKILSTTDDKLNTLRSKKERYERLKKGLMQKLLTGEVRVKV